MLAVVFIPFGRLLEPMVVGLSLPLSIVGAMLALLITHSDFGVISLLGLLFLLGLLDKNALLLLDYASQLRRAGMQRTDAIMKTGLVRLRPIMMTTASTVLGMMPLALGLGAGAELRQPMAVAIIGGLITSHPAKPDCSAPCFIACWTMAGCCLRNASGENNMPLNDRLAIQVDYGAGWR